MTRQRTVQATPNSYPKMDEIKAHYEKQYGGTVIQSGRQALRYSHIPGGSFEFNAMTLGGWVDGHVNLAYGWQGCSKTTMAAKAIAEAQRKYPDKLAVFHDAETHYDPDWFELNGVDLDRLQVTEQIGFAEGYADVVASMANEAEISIQVVDSIAAMVPMDTLDKSIEDAERMASRARVINRMCSELIAARQKRIRNDLRPITTLMLNQYRDSPGMFTGPTALPGGRQQHFASYLSVEFKKPKISYKKIQGLGGKDLAESPYCNEHVFKLDKAKAGRLSDSGKFKLVLSAEYPRHSQTAIDDTAVVMQYAKAFKMLGGGGKNQTFCMFPNETFAPSNGTKADSFMAAMLLDNPSVYELTKAAMVAMIRVRVNKPMLPADGYLMGFGEQDILPVVQQITEFANA